MQLGGRIELLAWNSAAALVGAAAMVVVLRFGILEPAHVERHGTATAAPIPPATDRMGFVKPGSVALRPIPPPELRPTLAPGQSMLPVVTASLGSATATDAVEAAAPDWSTETRAELRAAAVGGDGPSEVVPQKPASRFQVLPSLRLPWQTAKPAVPRSPATLKARLDELSPAVNVRLASKFEAAKAAWPPAEIALVAIKDERVVELHARPKDGHWKRVERYHVQAASGHAGPKLVQGDRQVPEGIYGIAFLNPNSAYHVSLRVNYPNAFDRQMAARDGRKDLGGDIMIHGKNLSAGCLAMGDEAAEELFVLAAQVGLPNVKLIIAPTDFRQAGVPEVPKGSPDWLPRLYADIASTMAAFEGPPKSKSLLSFFSK